MSQVSGIMKEKTVLKGKGKPTLVRRVSDMLKDGSYSGPPKLFKHASMQIRHCCQNLNLLPYLLYSFDNSKSHPIAREVHVCLSRFLHSIIASVLIAYEKNLRQSALFGFHKQQSEVQEKTVETNDDLTKLAAKLSKFERPKPKQHPFCLIAAVYLVPLLLVFQMTALCSLTITCKYTPGFIFLVTALFFLGAIALKILFNTDKYKRKKKVQ